MQRIERAMRTMIRPTRLMEPDELEARVAVLEERVESNTLAIERIEAERKRRPSRQEGRP